MIDNNETVQNWSYEYCGYFVLEPGDKSAPPLFQKSDVRYVEGVVV